MRLTERATQIILALITSVSFSAWAAETEPEAVPGEYIVKLRVPVSEDKAEMNALSERLGANVKSVISNFNMIVVQRPTFEMTKSVRKTLAMDPMVEYVEPNYIYHANKTPNDPMLGQLWGMNNMKTPGIDIGALQAWDITTGSKEMVVAVIDTGINYNHADLKDNLWVNMAEKNGQPGVDDDGNGVVDDIYGFNAIDGSGNPLDDHGHGSHCSGTIGAKGNDGKGIVGVNWNVRIMGVKFLSASGAGSLDVAIKAIDYATKMGAHILSNSWGGGGYSQALKEAIERSNKAGALFVAAAGNESNNNDAHATYPATYDVPNVLAVAAVDNNGNLASFSNYGKTKVHVAAPGVDIVSSSISSGGYDKWSGTSMATPHVSGIAALVLANEPNLTNLQLKQRLVGTARPLSSLRNKVKSSGIANAFYALTNKQPEPDSNDPVNWQSMSVQVSSAHPYKENGKETFQVKVPGARQISLYFSKFDTERDYDVVTIKDRNGREVQKISGQQDDTYSTVIEGDSATVEIKADDSVSGYGFDISKAAWR